MKTTLDHLKEVHAKVHKLLEGTNNILDENEYKYIKSTITKRAIPTVQLVIKDHKEVNKTTGNYPPRLVVPAKNFTAGFPHVGQRGITAYIVILESGIIPIKYSVSQDYNINF